MLIGYVSDEYFSALCDVAVEICRGDTFLGVVRSTPSGAIHADVAPGEYALTLAKAGFGSKRVTATVGGTESLHIRLLSDELYGYAWPKWVRSGEQSEFRVHSTEPYYLTLWRYGLQKQLVKSIGWFDEHGPRACTQLLPDGDFTQTGVQWNRRGYVKSPVNANSLAPEAGGVSAVRYLAQAVTAPMQSGLYYFHAECASGRFLSFPWVVAPQRPSARVAVLASTNTWNSYNNFGGRSNYINADKLPPHPTVNARLDLGRFNGDLKSVWEFDDSAYAPLSFDRPEPFNHVSQGTQATDPIRGRQPCHLAEAEWRLLAWLEREEFEYDFYSDQQLDDGTLDLDAFAALIISTHPEYWSRSQLMRVREWVFERGGQLLYLGGNGIDCEIAYPTPSTMVCYNAWPEMPGVPYRDVSSGKLLDCRMHRTTGISPAELLGVVFTEPGCATSAPFKVLDARHWMFAGTNLKDGDIFGAASLHERCPGGASGHETDKRSPSSPKNLDVAARGLNVDNGGAEIIYHESAGGGSVFSVGSITWTASVLVDPNCSQITRNALTRALRK